MKPKRPVDLEDQQKKFCVYRYEFFKRSKAFVLVKTLQSKLMLNSGALFTEDFIEAARQESDELLRYVELYLSYQILGKTTGATARTGMSLDITVIENREYTMKHAECRFKKLYIPVFLYEALDLDSNINSIKARIISELQKCAPTDIIGITEVIKTGKRRAAGKFLKFDLWKRCLDTYDKMHNGESRAELSKKIERPGQADTYYKNRSNATRKIKEEFIEAKRLIESAANGTFPD